MKKKIFTLLTLLVCVCTGVWADAVTIGLTQNYYTATKTNKIWTSLTEATDHLLLTQQIGSNILNYGKGDKGDVYLDGTKITDKGETNYNGCWRAYNEYYANQYIGYDLTISTGYVLNISNIYARALSISNATLTWKLQILSNLDNVLYESAEQTLQNSSNPTPIVNVNVSSLEVAAQNLLTNISGSVKVRFWVKCATGQSTKYFGIDRLTITGSLAEDTRPTYTITANVAEDQSSYGTIDKAGTNEVAEGESIALTATANEGYNFVKWTKDDVEYATTASITLESVTADAAYIANFAQATRVKYPSTYAGTYGKMGTNYSLANGVNEKWADKDNKFTIPSYMHKYFYRPGYRFNKWAVQSDGTNNRYDSGDEVTITNAAISNNQATFNPNFVATNKTVADATEATDVTWSFAKSDMVFVDWQCGDDNKYEYYTVTATIAGELIDVPMKITMGKVANYGRSDDMAQTNNGTRFTIPAVKGMVVVIANAYTAFSGTTVAGSTEYTKSNNDKTLSYTYNGDDSEITIVIGEDNQYLKSIKVTYPAATTTVTTNAAKWASFTPSWNATLSDGATAYIITAVVGNNITASPVSVLKKDEGYFVKGAAASTAYTATATADDADVVSGNMIVGCKAEAAINASIPDSNNKYILGTDKSTGKAGLYLVNSDITVPKGKAYLNTQSTLTARTLSLDFEGDGSTGISSVKEKKELLSGEFYNLKGQRVAQPTKGLYIMNGYKVIIK